MTKSMVAALERVFANEIFGHDYQMRPSKLRDRLVAEGLIQMLQDRQEKVSGSMTVLVSDMVCLTHRGRMAYGEACKGVED